MRHSGLTLVEALVVAGLTSLIMGVLASLLVSFYRNNAFLFQQGTAIIEARRGVEDALRYIREASYGSDGSYPIQQAATSSIALWADVNNDGSLDTVSYAIASSSVVRTITLSTGTQSRITVSSFLSSTSTPLFRYYNASSTELTQPVDTSKISSVKMTIVTDVDPNRSPNPLVLWGTATLRNSHL